MRPTSMARMASTSAKLTKQIICLLGGAHAVQTQRQCGATLLALCRKDNIKQTPGSCLCVRQRSGRSLSHESLTLHSAGPFNSLPHTPSEEVEESLPPRSRERTTPPDIWLPPFQYGSNFGDWHVSEGMSCKHFLSTNAFVCVPPPHPPFPRALQIPWGGVG